MPNTDFTYEEFEGLLGSIYKTFKVLSMSKDPKDISDLGEIREVVTGFTKRHNLTNIDEILSNPRPTKHEWGQPREETCFDLGNCMSSFIIDYGIGVRGSNPTEGDSKDCEGRVQLTKIARRVMVRHGGFYPGNERKTLGELLSARKSF